MRRFSAEYLTATRDGMWDSTAALADLELADRTAIVDVGCGTGELTRVLAEESSARVLGIDRDSDLLAALDASVPGVRADALALPLRDGAVDLAVCQALLINLPEPERAVAELARVSSDLVAAIEPDNGAVEIDSSVEGEAALSRRARAAFIAGVGTDVTLGSAVRELFEAAALEPVSVRRYDHERVIEPPYEAADVEAVRRRASGETLEGSREELLAGGLSPEAFDELRAEWRSVGRTAADQMQTETYRRRESTPFYVTVARVPDGG